MAYSKRIHASILCIESNGRTLEKMVRNLRVVLTFCEATDGIHLLESMVVLPIDTNGTDGTRSLPSRMERRSCRGHERGARRSRCPSRTSALEVLCTYEMCTLGHPKLCGWFTGAFEFPRIGHRAGDVTNGFMADVAAEDEIKWLERLRWYSFGGHDTQFGGRGRTIRLEGNIVEERGVTEVATLEQGVPA
jgi:hypothetical protein